MTGLLLALFTSTLETTIVSTSLVGITDDLGGLQENSWIVNAYLIAYTAIIVIAAKLSDILGRKILLVAALVTFTVFSIGCGLSQTFVSLVVLRAFQGLGGGAVYSLIWVILAESVPPEAYAKWSAVFSLITGLSALLGPLFGGIINRGSAWRWIFLLNGPGGFLTSALIWYALPWSFPQPSSVRLDIRGTICLANFKRVDSIGASLLLTADILLVTALEEGGTNLAWTNATVLVLLLVSIAAWVLLLFCSRRQAQSHNGKESMFPWRIATNRFAVGVLLMSFLNGAVFTPLVTVLPQSFQTINGSSALDAAYRLLALTLSVPVGAGLSGVLLSKYKIAPFHFLLSGFLFQAIGLGLIAGLRPDIDNDWIDLYGYQVITGVGIGIVSTLTVMLVPSMFEDRDISVEMGAVNQFRVLGGMERQLLTVLRLEDIKMLLQSARVVQELPEQIQLDVWRAFNDALRLQSWVIFAFGASGMLALLMLWERPLRKYHASANIS